MIAQEVAEMKNATRRLVDEVLIPKEQEVIESRKLPFDIYEKLKKLGYYGLTIPKEYGGLGIGLYGYCLVFEELCRSSFVFINELSLTNGLGKGPIYYEGTEEQKQKYLPKFASGKLTCAFALTEPNAGSDAAAILTRAEKKGDKWVINGRKHFISNGAGADVVMVLAVTDRQKGTRGGMTAFIVEKGTPGFEVSRLQKTMAGPPEIQAELVFEDCEVPEENVIGTVGQGFRAAMKTLDEGRVQTAVMGLGAAKRLLKMSTDYAKLRVQFGMPIAAFQAIQFMLAEMATDIYAAEQMIFDVARRIDKGEKLSAESAMVKLYATEMACRVADKAVQIHGGMGYMSELAVERIYREVRVLRIVEGTSEIQKLVIARNLLK